MSFFDPSPDGKAVVFATNRGEGRDLFRVDPPNPAVELTRDPRYSDDNPVWSPDGKEIAFSRIAVGAPDATAALWVMNADGTNPRRVTDFSSEMVWLPGGKALIAQGKKLVRLDVSSAATQPFDGPKVGTIMTTDPSGQWLAYQTTETGIVKVSVVATAGGESHAVDTGPYEAFHPFFSPSNRWIYFQPAHKNIFRVPGPAQNWAAAAPEKVTDFSGIDLYIESPKISRDGTKLFYTRGRRTGDIVILRLGSSGEKKTK